MSNPEFELAEQFALHTRKHCFVTGRAGTGKTSLLRKLVQSAQKNIVVVAPTGIAAVNAGGVTLHSMFGLPLTCFVPSDDPVNPGIATNRRLLTENLRLRAEKVRVLRELDLLIIDEISMARCDTLDAIDFTLRKVRGVPQPFGDVQVVFIGDIHQLPPVAREAEWAVLRHYYRSPYFFDALVWPKLDAARIELQTVYRQRDARFLSLLEHIRHRRLDPDDERLLRERYDPHFTPQEPGFVLLTTHNHQANSINASELSALPDRAHAFVAEIAGEFPEALYPCDRVLEIKVGAQVMFIRNDTEGGAYYNGKLATVRQIRGAEITVAFRDSGADYTLHQEIWENIGYGLEEDTGKVERKVLGTFSQYPLRLAWAITIHKSQGLTLDKVIVDAGRSFAAGQVYVALSRCRALDGLVLRSLITPTALREDPRIDAFSASHHATDELRRVLETEKAGYAGHLLLQLFSFSGLSAHLGEWRQRITATASLPDKEATITLQDRITQRVAQIEETAEKFRRQLRRLSEEAGGVANGLPVLAERCGKAIEYFTGRLALEILAPVREHIGSLRGKKKLKRYLAHVEPLERACWHKIEALYGAELLDRRLYIGTPLHRRQGTERSAETIPISTVSRGRTERGTSIRETLRLHCERKTSAEIAALRGLSVGTIKSHLARLIASGEIEVHEVLPADMISAVMTFLQAHEDVSLTAIRSGTGGHLDYNDLRMIVAHWSLIRAAADRKRA
jgi:tRNA A37 threonylcarbamoyladenosine biosynthesis protein TsaE